MTVQLLSQNETRLSSLDRVCDAFDNAAQLSEEIFQIVDLLDNEPGLRRAFTDPARTVEARHQLAAQLLQGKVSKPALHVIQEAITLRWSSGRAFVAALERQGVRAQLRAALLEGKLDVVEAELFQVMQLVEGAPKLRKAVADEGAPLAVRRKLMSDLLHGKTVAATERLALRAVGARERTFALTVEHYLGLAAALRMRQVAQVTVAQPLSPTQEKRLRELLAKQAGHDVDLQVTVDPTVIGGVRVLLGDDVIEGTVAGRLADVRRQLA